jgi:hypothetical protein
MVPHCPNQDIWCEILNLSLNSPCASLSLLDQGNFSSSQSQSCTPDWNCIRYPEILPWGSAMVLLTIWAALFDQLKRQSRFSIIHQPRSKTNDERYGGLSRLLNRPRQKTLRDMSGFDCCSLSHHNEWTGLAFRWWVPRNDQASDITNPSPRVEWAPANIVIHCHHSAREF